MAHEKIVSRPSGFLMLFLELLALPAVMAWMIVAAVRATPPDGLPPWWLFWIGIPFFIVWFFALFGFFKLEPNEAGILLLFGNYQGTVRRNGFYWANPLLTVRKISLRVHNFNGEKLKVNDKMGSPIEIAAVVVWRVHDTYAAAFEVEDYQEYVQVQSESALRHLASRYTYDFIGDEQLSLRGSIDEVSNDLQAELGNRLEKAGVEVIETRLSHLAYAPEIAEAMLKRQQAEAIVAARRTLIDGAVGMVEMALNRLRDEGTLTELDQERKATMIGNLLVVLCGDHAATPVINAGSLY
jgi:regulator of protease activity HflC (stomatin/prohibitin superfamily)